MESWEETLLQKYDYVKNKFSKSLKKQGDKRELMSESSMPKNLKSTNVRSKISLKHLNSFNMNDS